MRVPGKGALADLVYFGIIGYTRSGCRHAGENRHPVLIDDWIPAFAGMTYVQLFRRHYTRSLSKGAFLMHGRRKWYNKAFRKRRPV
jgi:hypothetical protein